MQISVQLELNWNWPTGTELGKKSEENQKINNRKIRKSSKNAKMQRKCRKNEEKHNKNKKNIQMLEMQK